MVRGLRWLLGAVFFALLVFFFLNAVCRSPERRAGRLGRYFCGQMKPRPPGPAPGPAQMPAP